jgi:hypothetical protein
MGDDLRLQELPEGIPKDVMLLRVDFEPHGSCLRDFHILSSVSDIRTGREGGDVPSDVRRGSRLRPVVNAALAGLSVLRMRSIFRGQEGEQGSSWNTDKETQPHWTNRAMGL